MGLPPGPEVTAKPSDFRPPNVALTTLKIATFAPMPRARVSTMTSA